MKNHYHIRLNIHSLENGLENSIWRVFENGVAIGNARSVTIKTETYTEKTFEDYPDKLGKYERYNIACDGFAVWDGDQVTII